MCPRCGSKKRTTLAKERGDDFKGCQNRFGEDRCSAVTINHSSCSFDDLGRSLEGFKKKLRNVIARKRVGFLDGEIEIVMEKMMKPEDALRILDKREEELEKLGGISSIEEYSHRERMEFVRAFNLFDSLKSEKLPRLTKMFEERERRLIARTWTNESERLVRDFIFEDAEIFIPIHDPRGSSLLEVGLSNDVGTRLAITKGSLKLHFHGALIHPHHSREQVNSLLEKAFGTKKEVWVGNIINKKLRNGRIEDGVFRWLKYSFDKASAVKGKLRTTCDPREQAVLFDAYAKLAKGTRRRSRMQIGRKCLVTNTGISLP